MRLRALTSYWGVVRIAAREDSANPKRIAASVALGVLRLGLLAAIYKVAYHVSDGDIALSYANVIWSMGLYFAFIVGLNVRGVFKWVETDIKDGSVEMGLVRPLDWRLVKLCQQLGKNIIECLVLVAAFAGTLFIMVGAPNMAHATPGFWLGWLTLAALMVVTAGAMYLCVGLVAFWLNDAQSVYRLIDKTVMIFGGAFVPVALLPDGIQTVLRYTPFGIFGASTQLFNPGLATHLVPTIISGVVWSIVLILTCQWIWHAAQRRIEVNGG
ncbi:MAG TPA: ABC-2 family transporter protein [Candidatus Saccharimonadales bacterium]|nr:ABC-2 family transporter protein [Candidatus Saccharimonadales bacterium]